MDSINLTPITIGQIDSPQIRKELINEINADLKMIDEDSLDAISEIENDIEQKLDQIDKTVGLAESVENEELEIISKEGSKLEIMEPEFQDLVKGLVSKRWNGKFKFNIYLRPSLHQRFVIRSGEVINIACFGTAKMLLDVRFYDAIEGIIKQFPLLHRKPFEQERFYKKELLGKLVKISNEEYAVNFPLIPSNCYTVEQEVTLVMRDNKFGIVIARKCKVSEMKGCEDAMRIELSKKYFEMCLFQDMKEETQHDIKVIAEDN